MEINDLDIYFMKEALKEAKKAYKLGEVPIGCVITSNNLILSRGYNKRQMKQSVLSHAEVEAIKKVEKKLNSWMLDDLCLYVTVEPCLMCSGIIMQSRIKRVVFGCFEPKFGAMGSVLDVTHDNFRFNHKIEKVSGVLSEECQNLVKDFFKELRKKRK